MVIEKEGFIELYDLTTKAVISKTLLTRMKFVPRAGERILISPTGPGGWRSYKVLDVEYFLNYDPDRDAPQTPSEAEKITLYVEPTKQLSR